MGCPTECPAREQTDPLRNTSTSTLNIYIHLDNPFFTTDPRASKVRMWRINVPPWVVCVSSHANAGVTPLCSRLSVKMSHQLRRVQEHRLATSKHSLSWYFRVLLHALCCVRAYSHLYSQVGCFKCDGNDDDSHSSTWRILGSPTKRCFLFLGTWTSPFPSKYIARHFEVDTRIPSMRKSQLRSRMLGLKP